MRVHDFGIVNTEGYCVKYQIIVNSIFGQNGELAGENYGANLYLMEQDDIIDEKTIENITVSYDRIIELMDLLKRNFVFPSTAIDIVEDFLL